MKTLLTAAILVFAATGFANTPEYTDARDTTGQLGKSADQQVRGSDRDVELTRLARQRIVSEDALSTNAKNVKIITVGNVMTLRGPVNSQAEKNRVGELAKAAAPRISVVNELAVESVNR